MPRDVPTTENTNIRPSMIDGQQRQLRALFRGVLHNTGHRVPPNIHVMFAPHLFLQHPGRQGTQRNCFSVIGKPLGFRAANENICVSQFEKCPINRAQFRQHVL